MKPSEFPQQNIVFAEDQDEFLDLPAHFDTSQGVATFCLSLNKEEIEQVKKTGKIYLSIFTGGQPLQPIGTSFLNPFEDDGDQDG